MELKEQKLKLVYKNFQSKDLFIFSAHASDLKKFKHSNGVKG